MKLTAALAAFACVASVTDARRKPSRFSVERIEYVKQKMERHYGRGFVGMFDENGKLDASKLGWQRHGRRLGESITMTLENLSFDASTWNAFFLGSAKGLQWDGLEGDTTQLSNCFAAMYSNLETVDLLFYDWDTISAEEGTWKGFDVFVADPIKILADNVVTYEMCEFGHILDQYKQMLSLDWASLSDNVVRQTVTLVVEMPESFALMDQIYEAGKCAAKAAESAANAAVDEATDVEGKINEKLEDVQKDIEKEAEEKAKEEAQEKLDAEWAEDDWNNFVTDVETDDIISTDDLEASGKKAVDEAAGCIDIVNMYDVGILGGKLFATFFNNNLKPIET